MANGCFTQAVWRAVASIPPGRAATYAAIAQAAGNPRAARAVAVALRQAPESLPWHRVVASRGRIALAGEAGFEQRSRLAAEGVRLRNGKVPVSVLLCEAANELCRDSTLV